MWRQGICSRTRLGGTNCIRRQEVHGSRSACVLKFMQVGESSKASDCRRGAWGEFPYPPSSRKRSSNFRSCKRARSSFGVDMAASNEHIVVPAKRSCGDGEHGAM